MAPEKNIKMINLFQINLQSGSAVPDANPTINVQFMISQVNTTVAFCVQSNLARANFIAEFCLAIQNYANF